jgi:ubiquinone/menaquinone biosynthesis C-methylase UbiE
MRPGLVTSNFRKIAPNGLGDPYNAYPHAMFWFNDHLYVGTTRANLANRGLQVSKKTPERIGEIWPVKIPDSAFDNDLRAQMWRYHPPTNKWTKVYSAPMVKGIEGFDVSLSIGFRCMASFQGRSDSSPALYFPTWGTYQTPSSHIIRSGDGVNFDVVSEPGVCTPDNKPWGLRGLASFKGRLFASPAAGIARHEPNLAGFTVIYVSSDPARGEWQLASEPHFGDPNNLSVFQLSEFNGFLYAGTLNIKEGYQVWKTDAEGEPPFKWQKVISHGAYRGKLNQIAMTLTAFQDCLYVGSGIQNGGFDFDNNIGPGAPELIRIHPDDSWDLVVGEPRITPKGLRVPLSGLGPGFGNPFSGYIWSICVHDGWLYVGTAVWLVFLRYSGKEDRWPKQFRDIFTPENVERMLLKFGGSDLWRTRDGYHWSPVTQNGFDNCFNLGFRNMVSSPYGLFVGAANPFSPEVAVRRVAGWNYEKNPKGGLEIWAGSSDRRAASLKPSPLERSHLHLIKSQPINDETEEKDKQFIEAAIDGFFGHSGFRNFGYWTVSINDARNACENLMDEIMAFIPEKKGRIVDVCCGLGASTSYLLNYFPAEAITGIATDEKVLEDCRKRAPGINFVKRKLPHLLLPAESHDIVIWVKGSGQLGTRKELIEESYRVLKPGGRLVCLDLLSAEIKDGGLLEKMRRKGRLLRSPDEYRNLLVSAGFQRIGLTDVTDRCLQRFHQFRTKYFGLKRMSGEIDNEMFKKIEVRFDSVEAPVGKCLLVSACKPEDEKEQ